MKLIKFVILAKSSESDVVRDPFVLKLKPARDQVIVVTSFGRKRSLSLHTMSLCSSCTTTEVLSQIGLHLMLKDHLEICLLTPFFTTHSLPDFIL